MRILICLAEPLPPQASGGSQKVAFEVATLLQDGGDHVAVAGRLRPKERSGVPAALRAIRARRLFDRKAGEITTYHFFRGGRGLNQVLDAFQPDVVILHTMSALPIADAIMSRNIAIVLYWHDVEFHKIYGSPPSGVLHIANSQFTATRLAQRFGIFATVIPPIFKRLEADTTAPNTRDHVLFINPVPDKGLDRVIEIARACPDLTFEFVESWVTGKEQRRALQERLRDMPNVILTPRQSNMAPIYQRAWLLLAPSQWEEAWGRVVSEAQSFGVPVLASKIGGLPEAVGSGGLLFSPSAQSSAWIASIKHLRDSPAAYRALAEETKAAAMRSELDPLVNIQKLQAQIGLAIAQVKSA